MIRPMMPEPGLGTPVKPPQSRDGKGSSAVYLQAAEAWGGSSGRVYVKRQESYFCRPAWRAFRRTPTLRRELRGLAACRDLGVPVPAVVAYREDGPRAELVLEEIAGALPLDRALGGAAACRDAIIDGLATVVARLHKGGWTHGALYPEHILASPDGGVVLIDLEKARRSCFRRRSDLDRFRRHSEGLLTPREAAQFDDRYREALASD